MKEMETKTLSREQRKQTGNGLADLNIREANPTEQLNLESPKIKRPETVQEEPRRSRISRSIQKTEGLGDEKFAESERKRRPKKLRVRLIPIWLRIIIVLVLIVICFFIGTMIGYGVIGDGNPTDVFHKETWSHIFDIVNEGTDGID